MKSFKILSLIAFLFLLNLAHADVVPAPTCSDLFKALRGDDLVAGKALLAQGAPVNCITPSGLTPLSFAAHDGLSDFVAALLAAGAKADYPEGQTTALSYAAGLDSSVYDSVGIAKMLLAAGAKANAWGDGGMTPLINCFFVYEQDSYEMAKLLIDAGADVNLGASNYFQDGGRTALMYASLHQSEATLKLLIDAGASVNAKSHDGLTALLMAAGSQHHFSSIKFLLDAGADIHAADHLGRNALIFAASSLRPNSGAMISLLLAHGAEVNAVSRDPGVPCTALMGAAHGGALDIINILLGAGADIKATCSNGNTILYFSYYVHVEVIKALISAGMDVNAVDDDGYTAIQHFSRYGCGWDIIDNFSALIAAGANINAVDKDGFTPLMLAARYGERSWVSSVASVLSGAGADKKLKNKDGMTAYDIALKYRMADELDSFKP